MKPAAKADTIGQSQSFYISPKYDSQSRSIVQATLRQVSDHAYFYVEDGYWNGLDQGSRDQAMSKINSMSREFDGRIYPLETQFFGSEPNPGIDKDPRVTILLAQLKETAGGYFDTSNEFSIKDVQGSNEREMLYINAQSLSASSQKANIFLAHEFQHLISFNQKELRGVTEDVWLNELRSEYAPTLLGYNDNFFGSNLERRSQNFQRNPSDSLTEWNNETADYGQIDVFGEYIAEHWSPKIIADSTKTKSAGIQSINDVLAKNGFKERFIDVFRDWAEANILNDPSGDPKLGYTGGLANMHINATKVISYLDDISMVAVSDNIKDWQAKWYDVSSFAPGQSGFLKLDFTSSSLPSFSVVYITFKSDGTKTISVFNPTDGKNTLYIDGIGKDVTRVIFIPIKGDKITGFMANEPATNLTFTIERVKEPSAEAVRETRTAPQGDLSVSQRIADGSLIRATGDTKVYVISGQWRRHIASAQIFKFYPQFGFDKVIEVAPEVLQQYEESNFIRLGGGLPRLGGGSRVYSIDAAGRRHWLKMTAANFFAMGGRAEAIFPVNSLELNFYKIGSIIYPK